MTNPKPSALDRPIGSRDVLTIGSFSCGYFLRPRLRGRTMGASDQGMRQAKSERPADERIHRRTNKASHHGRNEASIDPSNESMRGRMDPQRRHRPENKSTNRRKCARQRINTRINQRISQCRSTAVRGNACEHGRIYATSGAYLDSIYGSTNRSTNL